MPEKGLNNRLKSRVQIAEECGGYLLDAMEHGAHCSHFLCGQFTNIPLNCEWCPKMFCTTHGLEHVVTCPHKPKNTVRINKCPKCKQTLYSKPKGMTFTEFLRTHQDSGCKRFVRKKLKCKKKGCRSKAIFSCPGCEKHFCVYHRMVEQHSCNMRHAAGSCRGEVVPSLLRRDYPTAEICI